MLRNYQNPLPPQLVIVTDNAEAQQIATFYELAHELKDPGCEGPRYGALIEDSHPTHWVVCVRHWGHTKAQDNGFSAFFLPKDVDKTSEAALQHFRDLL